VHAARGQMTKVDHPGSPNPGSIGLDRPFIAKIAETCLKNV
jgi:hypothetical protein